MIKVLMFGWEFPPHISGGLGTACYGLTKGLSKIKQLEVIFVVPRYFGDEESKHVHLIGANQIPVKITQVAFELNYGKSMEWVEVGSKIIPYTSPEDYYQLKQESSNENQLLLQTDSQGRIPFSGGYGTNLYAEIYNYSLVAAQLAKTYDFDIIHAHDWLTYPAGIAAKQASGKPLVLHVHATDFDRSGGSVNPRVYAIEKEGMNQADAIIAVSNLTRNTIISNYKIPSKKVVSIHNAVEPISLPMQQAELSNGIEEKIVTFLGRITLQKGPEYFIEAANKVLQKMDNVRFVMAGSGDMMHKMVERAARLGITDKFHFTGFLKGADVLKMFSKSDLYIMPSVSEPFGISPLEAMQSGVPVIISKQSGVSEILKHVIKIDFWDIDKMANAIYAILSYPALSNLIKEKGLAEANNLIWDKPAKKVYQVYKKTLRNVKA